MSRGTSSGRSGDRGSPDTPRPSLVGMTTPRVTVAVSAYNAGEFLVASIESLLAQTLAELEVVVVDDGSTDGSVDALEAAVQDSRLVLLRQENQGKSIALNRVMDEAQGEYVMIHDADDLSYPTRAARLVAHLDSHPEQAAVFSRHNLVIGEHRFAPRSRPVPAEECARF